MEDDKLNFHFNLNTWFIFICQMNDKILFKILSGRKRNTIII